MTIDPARMKAIRAELARREAKTSSRVYVVEQPTPRQQEFLECTAFEAMYGGAAGGGKSSALLLAALQYVHIPRYAALILRRTFADLNLPGAIMDRAKAWLVPRGVDWNQTERRFTFPSGATLTFGYLDTLADKYRYQGMEVQFIGVDELTQWQEESYRYLLSRLRRASGVEVPLRARSASNPGGIGHDWVYRRFVDEQTRENRVFVPAKLSDNPHVQEDYANSLEQLSPVERAQLRDGEWVRDSEGLVYPVDDELNIVNETPRCDTTVLGIDFGVVDATAFTVIGWRTHDPVAYVLSSEKLTGLTTSDAAAVTLDLMERYKPARVIGDVGGLGKVYANDFRERWQIPIEPAEKVNKRGYISLMNDAMRKGNVKAHRTLAAELIAEWRGLVWADGREKEHPRCPNHAADATLYAWRAALSWAEQPAPVKVKPGSQAYYDDLERRLDEQAEQRDEMEWAS